MAGAEELRAKLAKVEELFRRAGSAGERAAAGAAMERLRDPSRLKAAAFFRGLLRSETCLLARTSW